MIETFDAVLAQALKLPSEERRALIAHLQETLEPGDREPEHDLGAALDVGIAELDRGLGIESTIDGFMTEIDAAVGLAP